MRVAACFLLVCLAPTAAAQMTYELALEMPEEAAWVQPETEELEQSVSWRITCSPTAAPGTPVLGSAVLGWDLPEVPAGFVVAPPAQETVAAPDCVSSMETTGEQTFRISALRQAPGLVPVAIGADATLTWDGTERQDATGSTRMNVVVHYHGAVAAMSLARIQQAGPGETSVYEVNVTNFGNAPSYVLIRADDGRVEVAERWPEAPLAVGESAMLTVRFHHPDGSGWNNDEAGFILELTPIAAGDEDLSGQSVFVPSLARTRGVPAVGLPLVTVALALAAIRRG